MMRVVLRSDVPNLGKRGDMCDVADGYARNFLFPKGQAIPASSGIADQAAKMRRAVRPKMLMTDRSPRLWHVVWSSR